MDKQEDRENEEEAKIIEVEMEMNSEESGGEYEDARKANRLEVRVVEEKSGEENSRDGEEAWMEMLNRAVGKIAMACEMSKDADIEAVTKENKLAKR